ncbi:MAG: radical SAM protein [Deltaproteobacteria bacterium]|nr:radical SAM protein [Deltaproteobacteria bacterium]MBW2035764.1 radical SAM protein [Deltaproteobacteria bacterium]MBW2116837.1 radical SAM protein [Deltaproteobacteria bacterium]MBW2342863.1 radical SAM protein [Deltaproteobacteria bacterium]
MSYVFGPVPSRRLGLSLGVDLIPPKTCTFDCLYCEVGRTTSKTIEPGPFVPFREVVYEIEKKLMKTEPDAVTLAGSGEPTLYSRINEVIDSIKEITEIKVALLTNGSLFWKEEIRRRVLKADIIMPTLSSAFEDTFRMIHRPHPGLELNIVVDGLKRLRKDYKGLLFLEIVLLAGINDTEKEVEGLKTVINRINPEKIQLNTVLRPPADKRAISLDRKRLEDIKVFLGEKAEIIAGVPVAAKKGKADTLIRDLLDMVKRRPLRSIDIVNAMGLSSDDVEDLVKGLLIKGYISRQEHSGEIYYLSNGKDI